LKYWKSEASNILCDPGKEGGKRTPPPVMVSLHVVFVILFLDGDDMYNLRFQKTTLFFDFELFWDY